MHTLAYCSVASILMTFTVTVRPDATFPVHVGLVTFNFANNSDSA